MVEGDTEAANAGVRSGLTELPAAGASGTVMEARAVRRNPRLNARFDAGGVVESSQTHSRATVAVEAQRQRE
ncbi:MAG: hypothetical protein ACO32I_08265 [Candidatus Limnocylindrus sp.]